MTDNTREKEFLKRLWDTFKIEAEEHLKSIASGLLELEKKSDSDNQGKILDNIYRRVHSLKGSARAVDINSIESICQHLENIFKYFKYNSIPDSPEMFDVLQRTIDTMELILTDQEGLNINPIIKELGLIESGNYEFLPSSLARKPPDTSPGIHRERFKAANESNASDGKDNKGGRFAREGFGDYFKKKENGNTSAASQFSPSPTPEKTVTPDNSDKYDTGNKTLTDMGKIPTKKIDTSSTIRVTSTKLDSLLLQAEEMIFMKLALSHRQSEMKEVGLILDGLKKRQAAVLPLLKLLRKHLAKENHEWQKMLEYFEFQNNLIKELQAKVKRISKSLQDDHRIFGIMVNTHLEDLRKTLLLPFSSLTESFPRMIRDIARQNAKEIDFVMKGIEIEIDKRILEEMKDPLIHLLRNAVGHGIETPEERAKNNKPPRGLVELNIIQKENNKVEISLSDDGMGVNLERVKEKAVSSGYFTPEELERSSEQDILSLIFNSEFSTSPIITDLSGRGLGLTIVRERVEKLGGRISIKSIPGKGTTFIILLQTTLSTFRGILVKSDLQKFIIPTLNVEKVLRIDAGEIKTVENRETIKLDDCILSFVRLSDVLQLKENSGSNDSSNEIVLAVLSAGDRRIAFQVDEVLNEQEVLVKDLGKQLSRVKNIAGATVLGSGDVVPVLNVVDLLKTAVIASTGPRSVALPIEKPAESEPPKKSVLIVEDSITSRMLLKNILESAGYNVQVAVDGMDGWITVKEKSFDLVLLDVEMPGMTGFELTEKIRKDRNLSEMPVILVTSLESREDREKGIDVGADAYIVKSSFDQSNLLEVIKKLI